MVDLYWIVAIGAGAICYGAGLLARSKSPNSNASLFFMFAMSAVFVMMMTAPIYPLFTSEQVDAGNAVLKVSMTGGLLGFVFLWQLTVVFPHERKIKFRPPNQNALVMLASVVIVIVLGSMSEARYAGSDEPLLTDRTSVISIAVGASMVAMATGLTTLSTHKMDSDGRRSSKYLLLGLWIYAVSAAMWVLTVQRIGLFADNGARFGNMIMAAGMGLSGLVFALAIATGNLSMNPPKTERLTSSTKAKYRLIHRYVYLVEEPKPMFAFTLFTDILKGRCWDCANDDSFTCESLDCASCKLPCPCHDCTKYKSRPQGLVVTRQFPVEVRSKHFVQTTPIVWLSSVAGKDNMDPAKLSLLTDSLMGFMEKSQNGVVVVDGLEYLVTSNDFSKVLKAVDRWTESAMTSNSRLILSIDPRSFEEKEVALLERNREIVRPDADKKWKIIPEPI